MMMRVTLLVLALALGACPDHSRECRNSRWCATWGKCKVVENPGNFDVDLDCEPGDTMDCRTSTMCNMGGICAFDATHRRCVIGTAYDCERTDLCKRYGPEIGTCYLKQDRCVRKSEL